MGVLASNRARARQALGIRPLGMRPALVKPPEPTLEELILGAADRLNRGWGASCPVCDGQLAPTGRCGGCGSELS
jgi:hypothetical protein